MARPLKRGNLTLAALLTASILGLPFRMAAGRAETSVRPSLVIGITVEGLDQECLDLLRQYFTDGGFNLLMSEGVTLSDLSYGPGVDAVSATSMLFTGAPASVTGFPGATVYDPATRTSRPPLRVGTSESYSPVRILVSTLADEIRIAEGGTNHVYAIAPDPQQAVVMAGHAGSAALWIDNLNGNWTTDRHYSDVPAQIGSRNFTRSLASRLDTLKWEPTMAPERYPGIPSYKAPYPFKHTFRRGDADRFRAFKLSAPANREVTALATELIRDMRLGLRDVTDMVALSYTVAPYPYSPDPDSRMEVLDSYLRLDADLRALFRAVEQGPGMDNTLIFLAGTPAPPSSKRDEERFGIPYGQFSARKAVALLNMYLIANHGNGDWVQGYHNRQIFLNRDLVKTRGLNIEDVRRESADFLKRVSGVCRAWTVDDLTSGSGGAQAQALERNIVLEQAGDVFVTITPGWEIVEDDSQTHSTPRPEVSRLASQTYPAFILAPGLDARIVGEEVDACILAPTVSRLLRIRSPNGAAAHPLRLK